MNSGTTLMTSQQDRSLVIISLLLVTWQEWEDAKAHGGGADADNGAGAVAGKGMLQRNAKEWCVEGGEADPLMGSLQY
jgi:hypothetical protein